MHKTAAVAKRQPVKQARDQAKLAWLLEQLPLLTLADLDVIIQRSRALVTLSGGQAASTKDEPGPGPHDWLIDGMRPVLRARGLPYKMPIKIIHKLREHKEFLEAAEYIDPWLSKFTEGLDRTNKLLLAELAASSLARHIASFSPVTLEKLLHFYHKVPSAIEDSFPGYAHNGWLSLILAR